MNSFIRTLGKRSLAGSASVLVVSLARGQLQPTLQMSARNDVSPPLGQIRPVRAPSVKREIPIRLRRIARAPLAGQQADTVMQPSANGAPTFVLLSAFVGLGSDFIGPQGQATIDAVPPD